MKEELSLEEQACNYETSKHIRLVQKLLNKFASSLINRGEVHDESKLHHPEVKFFTELTNNLSTSTYNSEEYKRFLEKLKPALDHHYAKNRHHPQHFVNGVDDMNLLDIVEMFCDWKAATSRHDDGNLEKSIMENKDRFNLSPQIVKIFQNTVDFIEYE